MFFIPMISYLSIALTTVTVVLLRRGSLAQQVSSDRTMKNLITRMTLYVIAFAVAWSGPTAHRFAQSANLVPQVESVTDPSFLMWIDAIGSSLYGYLNAVIWLTNPTFYRAFVKRFLVRGWNWCSGGDAERVPLIPAAIADNLDDTEQDFQRLDNMLRKYVIMNILQGIETTLRRRSQARSARRPSDRRVSAAESFSAGGAVSLTDDPVHSGDERQQQRHSHGAEHMHVHIGRNTKGVRVSDDLNIDYYASHTYTLPSSTGNPFDQALYLTDGDIASAGGRNSFTRRDSVSSASADEAASQRLLGNYDSIGDLDTLTGGGGLGLLSQGYEFYDYAPEAFRKIRLLSGVTDDLYLDSLNTAEFIAALERKQKFSEGRSGSFFCFSPDKKLIIKTIPEGEAKLLRQILPGYVKHLSKHPDSLLSRFFGCHAVRVQGVASSELISVIVMQNVLDSKLDIHERYDLKGSWVRRQVGKNFEENPKDVLGMDLDLKRQLYLQKDECSKLFTIMGHDARFLRECGIMDYSLLLGFHHVPAPGSARAEVSIGIDDDAESAAAYAAANSAVSPTPDPRRPFWAQYDGGMLSADGRMIYFVGIIDILQAYDSSKKRERCFKVYFLRKDSKGISVQPPDVYCTRFLRAMSNLLVSAD